MPKISFLQTFEGRFILSFFCFYAGRKSVILVVLLFWGTGGGGRGSGLHLPNNCCQTGASVYVAPRETAAAQCQLRSLSVLQLSAALFQAGGQDEAIPIGSKTQTRQSANNVARSDEVPLLPGVVRRQHHVVGLLLVPFNWLVGVCYFPHLFSS